jgi:ADP-ribose pyrophosphatase YjhB (NUDIX family)
VSAARPERPIRIRVGGVFIQGQSILLVRHQKGGRSYWLLPGGGVEYGEGLAEALEREMQEECGLAVRVKGLLFVNESLPPDRHRHIVNLTFLGEVLSGEAHLNEDDGVLAEVAWVPRSELPGLTFFPNFKQRLLEAWDSGFTLPAADLGNLWES